MDKNRLALRPASAVLLCWCRDPATILPEKIEGALLTALDNETDGAIAAQIQATLQTLLRAGSGAAPSYWLSVCSAVALSAPAAAPRASGGARESGTGTQSVSSCLLLSGLHRQQVGRYCAVLPSCIRRQLLAHRARTCLHGRV